MSDFHILNRIVYPDKPRALSIADDILFTARTALGYEDITYKKAEGENKFVIERSKEVCNIFMRIIAGIGALTLLLIPSLIALAIKCCLKSRQDKDIEKLNQLVEKNISTTKKENSLSIQAMSSSVSIKEEKTQATMNVSKTKAAATTESRPDETLKGIDLQLFYWKQLAGTQDSDKSKSVIKILKKLEPDLDTKLISENIEKLANSKVQACEALAKFAEKAVNGQPNEDIVKGNTDIRSYLCYRIFKLRGGKTEQEYFYDVPKLEKSLLENPKQNDVLKVARELKEKGYVGVTFEEPIPNPEYSSTAMHATLSGA